MMGEGHAVGDSGSDGGGTTLLVLCERRVRGYDRIEAADDRRDVIDCGGGKDAVWFDERLDTVSADCELRNVIHSGR